LVCQISPKLLLVSDRYVYNGKIIDVSSNVTEIVQGLASKGLESLVIVGQLEKDRRSKRLSRFDGVKTFDWPTFLKLDNISARDIDFWRGPAMAPVYILYSSGGWHVLHTGFTFCTDRY
jgi:acetoacetyl-CoA synthetase